jgi:chromosome segregation ATPase
MIQPPHKKRFQHGTLDEEQPVAAGDFEGADMAVESQAVLHSPGQEIDAILQTARDTAAKLIEEAERTRAEAHAAATHETETALREAESVREQVAKERAEAEAYAARLRSEAEAAAEKIRAEAERVAPTVVEAACTSLIESARARVRELQAEAQRHEERLEQLLGVWRDMTSKIEDVLKREDAFEFDVKPPNQHRAVQPEHQELGEALRPHAPSKPVA